MGNEKYQVQKKYKNYKLNSDIITMVAKGGQYLLFFMQVNSM